MPTVSLQTYKVLSQELSSSTKFNNLVQAVEDALNGIDGDNFGIKSTAATYIVKGLVTGDTVPRIRLQADGKIEWGAGGASAVDVNLYRQAANILTTDDELRVAGGGSNIIILSAGHQQFPEITAPANGAVNTGRLFVEDNGAGKSRLAVIFNTGAKQIIATEP